MPMPWLTLSDKLTDEDIARAEHHQRRRAKGTLDEVDRAALHLATSLLDHDKLVALLQRKPLLEAFDPAAYQALHDTIKVGANASPRQRAKRRTALLYKLFASDVNFLKTHHPEFSSKDKKAIICHVAKRHEVEIRTVERAYKKTGCSRETARQKNVDQCRSLPFGRLPPAKGCLRPQQAATASNRAIHETGHRRHSRPQGARPSCAATATAG
jgi:hypothetical protein